MLASVVVIPAVGLTWFMQQALSNEQAAIRQQLVETYRAQLSGIRQRVDDAWRRETASWAASTTTADAAREAIRLVTSGAADAVVIYDSRGQPLYPDATSSPAADAPSAEWMAAERLVGSAPEAAVEAFQRIGEAATDPSLRARAVQGQIRALLGADRKHEAWEVLDAATGNPDLAGARDSLGRLIVPALSLLQLDLATTLAPEREAELSARLRDRLLATEGEPLPAAQRRFLLRRLHGMHPDPALAAALAMEELSAAYTALPGPSPRDAVLGRSGIAAVWQNGFAEGRGVALHRTDTLNDRLKRLAEPTGLPADVQLAFIAPGAAPGDTFLSVSAGASMPGWQMAITVTDPASHLSAAAQSRATAYLWIVGGVVALVLVLATLAWGLIRRQAALTQLRNDLVANVTHELKTPLASMRLLVDTLLDAPRIDPVMTREYLQLISAENLRLSRLIGNFLTFSRIERNRYTFAFQRVAPATLVHAAAEAVRDRMNAPGCHFEVQVDDSLPEISADPDACVTALINLLDNAWKYSGDEKKITLSARKRENAVVFSVQDNGIGLAPRDVQRIFRRFEQVRGQATARAGGGVGLGLSIVHFIVAAHGGRVHVDSTLGRGSTFTLSLPESPAR